MGKIKAIIMGAAGRDFHNYNVYFKNNARYKVVAFTATQIPNIAGRKYKNIPIYLEEKIAYLIKKHDIEEVFFSYSDISHEELMSKATLVMSCGASFSLLSKRQTMIKSKKPVIAVTAVRTGCGKSGVAQCIADYFSKKGLKTGIVRHPMPYGDLEKQVCQKFESIEDLDKQKCTIEEREEYEPYLDKGLNVYAGVDYEKILKLVEKESDIILWDGGNNDIPFFEPDFYITLADARRPGHEVSYYPGGINFRSADLIIITKVDKTTRKGADIILENARKINPKAEIIESRFSLEVERPEMIRGKSVLVVEDGPSMTHGGLSYGGGYKTAKKFKAKKIIDPRKYAVGSLKDLYEKYQHMDRILPAMGYGKKQMKELEEVIQKVKCDTVIFATPAKIERILEIKKPYVRAKMSFQQEKGKKLDKILEKFLALVLQ